MQNVDLLHSSLQYSKKHQYNLVFWFYIEDNKSVPTYLVREAVYSPIKLDFDVSRIVTLGAYSILEPTLIDTNREASTILLASLN